MSLLLLRVFGEPATITAQQKGVNWKARTFYTKAAIKAERRRIKRNLHRWDDAEKAFVKVKQKGPPIEGPVHCSIKIVYPLTQEQAKKHADQLSNNKFELPHAVKPDVDNTTKLILDTITELRLWEDDSRVCDLNLHKRYGTNPGIQIAIKSAGAS